VYKNTHAIVKHQFKQAEKPMPAVGNRVDTARNDITILLDYSSPKVAPEEPEIGSSDPKLRILNNSTDDKLHIGMPGCSGKY